MEVKSAYKQTEIGVIPVDWDSVPLGAVASDIGDGIHATPVYSAGGDYYFINGNNLRDGRIVIMGETKTVDHSEFKKHQKELGDRSILMSINGTIGNLGLFAGEHVILGKSAAYINVKHSVSKLFIFYSIQMQSVKRQFSDGLTGTTIRNLGLGTIKNTEIPLPPTKAEQEAIAEALSDADALIESREQLLAKKRRLKQGAMQNLLRPKKGWAASCISQVSDCLDSLRIPLNDSQRAKMQGDYPYCGANGILDYINDYCLDDSVILMAEDGGYFDEYMTRPIAYRMSGKIWVNNHAHILKSKANYDQDFLFYSLVHKNILTFLASGTRAKLNRSELDKITIQSPQEKTEQAAIAAILCDMDAELTVLESKLTKARQLKQGMMQELLTGRTRFI
jgi:type I restriction enzyme S subunit